MAFTLRNGIISANTPHGVVRIKKKNAMKKPRLTEIDRHTVESMLKNGNSVHAIAKELSRPATTIMREIKARAVDSDKGAAHRVTNRCKDARELGIGAATRDHGREAGERGNPGGRGGGEERTARRLAECSSSCHGQLPFLVYFAYVMRFNVNRMN